MAHIQISQLIPAGGFEVFDYVCDPQNLKLLLAPRIQVEVEGSGFELKRDHELQLSMTRLALTQRVRLRIMDVLRGSRLTYRQSEGLFKNWTHTIKFEEHAERETLVTDLVDYEIPFGLVGFLIDDLFMKSDLEKWLGARLNKVREHFRDER